MAIALFGLLWLPPLLGRTGLLAGSSILRLWSLVGLTVALGGGVGGMALGRSWRAGGAFGLSFPLGLLGPFLLISAAPSLSGREPLAALAGVSVSIFALAFGLIGGLGTILLGLDWRRTGRAAAVGALAGVPGGLLLAPCLRAFANPNGGDLPRFLVSATAVCLVSALLCGWTLDRIYRADARGAGTPVRRS